MSWTLIEAPSVLGLTPSGVQDLPRALRAAGLETRLGISRAVRVEPPPYDPRRDRDTGMLNTAGIREYTRRLADAVAIALDRGARPLVLGGDCSILLGNLLGLARRGRYGLLFLDGHADFYQPDANVNGQAASSELAFATGRGPAALTRFDDHDRLITDDRVVALGLRDTMEAAEYGSQRIPRTLRTFDLSALRRIGIERAVSEAIEHLDIGLDGIWIHLDADVLDDAIMPAVDYRLPGGLSWGEAASLLGAAFATGSIAGMDVTIFNPRLDPDGSLAQSMVDLLASAR